MTAALLNLEGPEESNQVTTVLTSRPLGNKFIVSFLSNRGHFQFRCHRNRTLLYLFQKKKEEMTRRKRSNEKKTNVAVKQKVAEFRRLLLKRS